MHTLTVVSRSPHNQGRLRVATKRFGRGVLRCKAEIPPLSVPEPARPVMLSTGTLWILNFFQDKYYDVHGDSFIIQRAEGQVERHKQRKYHKPVPARMPHQQPDVVSLVSKATFSQPGSLVVYQIPANMMEIVVGPEQPVFPETKETGLVWVPSATTGVATAEDQDTEVMFTDSWSPRRTKMVQFKCLANGCDTVNRKKVNPHSVNKGTFFAQCDKCKVWHLIKDNLNLFHKLKGEVFPRSYISEGHVPESLKLKFDWHPELN